MPEELPPRAINSVASQIGELLATFGSKDLHDFAKREKGFFLGESFPIVTLSADDIHKGTERFESAVKETPLWHHQVKVGDTAPVFARSIVRNGTTPTWTVEEIYESTIGAKIHAGIQWIDRKIDEEVTARLIVSPEYFLHAFWIRVGDQTLVVAVDVPDDLKAVQTLRFYEEGEFLGLLREEDLVKGILFEEP